MIVVDVNTLAYLWIPGEMSVLAEAALARDPHWIAPVLWRSAFRNILAGYLRRKQLDLAAAARCLQAAEAQLAGCEFLVPSDRILRLLLSSTCSVYDCEYVALADDMDLTLVTSDRHILAQFPRRAVNLAAFARGG